MPATMAWGITLRYRRKSGGERLSRGRSEAYVPAVTGCLSRCSWRSRACACATIPFVISSLSLPPDGFVVLALPVALLIAFVVSRRRRDGPWRAILRFALATYLVILLAQLFFPFPIPPWTPPEIEPGGFYRPRPFPWANVIPFDTIGAAVGYGLDWQQGHYLLGNVIAFAPLGLFLEALRPHEHGWRRTLMTGLAVSLAIEAAQLGLSLLMGYSYRVADVDDLILNTGGVMLGYGALRLGDVLGRAILPPRLVFWAPPPSPTARQP